MSGEKPDLARFPNAKAKPLSLEFGEGCVLVEGYQRFRLEKTGKPRFANARLEIQCDVLGRYMTRPELEGKSFLDLGANAGFWSFLAASQGAGPVTAVEMDEEYQEAMKRLAKWADTTTASLRMVISDIYAVVLYDVVHALGLLHWLYACTAEYGSLDAIIGHLASLTRERLHVEWIAPEDPNIVEYGHLDWKPDAAKEPYDEEHFIAALVKHFGRCERLGEHTPTRHIWVAWKETK